MTRQELIEFIGQSQVNPAIKSAAIMGIVSMRTPAFENLAGLVVKAKALLEAGDSVGFSELARAEAVKANVPLAIIEPMLIQIQNGIQSKK